MEPFVIKLALISILVSLLFVCLDSAMVVNQRCSYAGLYNFGDSNSDTGGISAAFEPVTSPYGMTFFKKPVGRLSDGRLVFDFLAEYIGIPYTSAYLDTINTDYRHGANFATGGSTIRKQNESIYQAGISPFNLGIQTIQFTQFRSRIIDLWSSRHPAADISQLQRPRGFPYSLYTLDIGQNDLSVGFRTLSKQQLRAAIPDIINEFALSFIRYSSNLIATLCSLSYVHEHDKPINKSIWSIIQRLVVGACVYYVWQERNLMLFQGKARSAADVIDLIKKTIHLKLIGLKIRKTRQSAVAAELWNLNGGAAHNPIYDDD